MTPTPGAAANAVRIDRVSEETTITPQGLRQTNVRIDFHVGGHGPFTERFDKAKFNPVEANQKLAAFANQIVALGS